MKFITTIFICCLITASATAQRVCSTADYTSKLLQQYPSLSASYNAVEDHIRRTLNFYAAARDTAPNEVIVVPVIVHVLYKSNEQNITEAQVKSQIDVLNKDYRRKNADTINTPAVFKNLAADVRIVFCLAQVDPNGKRTKGIIRKHTNNDYFTTDDGMKYTASGGDDAWNCKRYLNIWVCNLGSRLLGYAAPPGGPADRDGVAISYDAFGTVGTLRAGFNKGRTATHEIGHWLGMKHLWGDIDCGDDDVFDTPRQRSYNYGCPVFPHATACSPNSNGDMFMNFMDFTDDACMNEFTTGQKDRMRALFAAGGPRNSFLNSFVCDSSLAQGGPLPDDPVDAVVPAPDPVKIYPNPTADLVTVTCKTAATLVGKMLKVYTMTGNPVLMQQLKTGTNTISLKSLPQGIYMIHIDTDTRTTVTIVRL